MLRQELALKTQIKRISNIKEVFLTFLVVLKRLSVSFLPSFSKVGHENRKKSKLMRKISTAQNVCLPYCLSNPAAWQACQLLNENVNSKKFEIGLYLLANSRKKGVIFILKKFILNKLFCYLRILEACENF